MKIATFNVNGINGRLPVLLRWLESSTPDVVCLQELKAPQEKFPQAALARIGYGSIWHGQKSWNGVAILARNADPIETRRALPGDPGDAHSRYIEATVRGIVIGCLYLPNGNPAPGPKFDYKLRWFQRLIVHASELLSLNEPVALVGDYNVMPTDLDVYKPERWVDDALFRPEVRSAFARLIEQGWTDALRKLHPTERIYTFWDFDCGRALSGPAASQMVLKKNGFQKVAGIDIQSHDGKSRTSFLFERVGESESDPTISAGTDRGPAAWPTHQWSFGSTSARRSR